MSANSESPAKTGCSRMSRLSNSAGEPTESSSNAPKGAFPRFRGGPEAIADKLSVLFQRLGILDRLLTPLILIFMVVGVLIGEFVPGVQPAFDTVQFDSVSVREPLILPASERDVTDQTLFFFLCQPSPSDSSS